MQSEKERHALFNARPGEKGHLVLADDNRALGYVQGGEFRDRKTQVVAGQSSR